MLSVIFNAIAAELARINAYAPLLQGEQFVRQNDPPPRMIVYPIGDSMGPVEGPGGNPKPLLTLLEGAELVIHGQTQDIVEGMRDQFLVALHHACKRTTTNARRAGRFVVAGGKWTRSTLIAKNGFEYKLSFSVAFPIVDRRWDALQVPDASDMADALTYPTVPGSEVETTIDVGERDNPPADDNVTIVINPHP